MTLVAQPAPAAAPADARIGEWRTLLAPSHDGWQSTHWVESSDPFGQATIAVPGDARASADETPATFRWTDECLRLIVKYQPNPLRAARMLSYVHVAMYDAGLTARRAGMSEAVQEIAVHSAASAVLEYFYPQEPEGRFGALARTAALAVRVPRRVEARTLQGAWAIGQHVAARAVERAAGDGAATRWSFEDRPKWVPGIWRATPPLNAHRPVEALAGRWKTWLLRSGAELSAPAPVAYDSPEYWREAREVLEVTEQLTADQKRIADEWNLGQATVTPPGVWNMQARQLAQEEKLTTARATRLFAVLNAAMLDAMVSCWAVKFTYWTQRPVTAIRDKYRPDFLPYLVTPAFPSYVSGHSTVSGAAAEVLAAFLPRHAEQVRAMAEEAALSRLYGGIHFTSDNDEGLALGRRIGQLAMTRLNPWAGEPAPLPAVRRKVKSTQTSS